MTTSQQECEQALSQLLDFSKPFPTPLFDQLVRSFQSTGNMNVDNVIKGFQKHPDAWTRVPDIVQQAQFPETKVQALAILESLVKTRWNTLGATEHDGIRNFVVELILRISTAPETMAQQRIVLSKLQTTLIAIVKCEWPHNWPSFVTDIVNSAKNSESVCISNMQILLLLSEEVFDYGKDQMTLDKMTKLKVQLNNDFQHIFDLCTFVLSNSKNPILLTTTLRALLRFLRWIPLEFILNTQLIPTLALQFFPDPLYRSHTIQCLNEIACLEYSDKFGTKYDGLYTSMLTAVLEHVYSKIITDNVDLNQLFQRAPDRQRQFFTFLTGFVTNFISKHLSILEQNPQAHPVLTSALALIIRLSLVEDDPAIFTMCLEFWNGFLKDVYRTEQSTVRELSGIQLAANSQFGQGFNQTLNLNVGNLGGAFSRLQFYTTTLLSLIQVMLVRMVKPEEVLIVVDEMGNADRVRLDTTETTSNYNLMRETFSFLTCLDSKRVMDIICEQTQEVIRTSQTDWRPHMLNRLCWGIGSISRALNEGQEKKLLATILKALLGLVDLKQRKDDKAIVASNIMYVVGQYPRFLRVNYSFLVTVIGKLFYFMHEKHPGVQDMAVDTFLIIAQRCKRSIIAPPTDQPAGPDGKPAQGYIQTILDNIHNHTCDLERQHLYTFYEAIATIISAESDFAQTDQMLFRLMKIPNEEWVMIVQQASQANVEVLKQIDTIRRLETILKINTRVASAVSGGGSAKNGGFISQISRIFMEMLVVYRLYSSYISDEIKQHGENVIRVEVIKLMRSVKREMLLLCTTFVTSASQKDQQVIQQRILPELINTVVQDYITNVPSARDSEVLNLFTAIFNLFKRGLAQEPVLQIFINLFPATLNMITANFEDNPEHRRGLYNFLRTVIEFNLSAIFSGLQSHEFQLVMDSIFWGVKHLTNDVQELALASLESILVQLQNLASPNNAAGQQTCNTFYQNYIFTIFNSLLGVLTDTFHRSSFNKHVYLLSNLCLIIKNNRITALLQEPIPPNADPATLQQLQQQQQQIQATHHGNVQGNNHAVVKHYLAKILLQGFNTVTPQQVEHFVTLMFDTCNELNIFRQHLTNFLIELKEFAPFVDELQQQQQQQSQQLSQQQQQQSQQQ